MLNTNQKVAVGKALLALAAGRDKVAAAAESGIAGDQVTLIDLVRGYTRTADVNADADAIYALAAAVPGFGIPEANAKLSIKDLLNAWATIGVPPPARTTADLDRALKGVRGDVTSAYHALLDLGTPVTATALAQHSGQPVDLAAHYLGLPEARDEAAQHQLVVTWYDGLKPENQAIVVDLIRKDEAKAMGDDKLIARLNAVALGLSEAHLDNLRHLIKIGRCQRPLLISVDPRKRLTWLGIAGVTGIAAALILSFMFGMWRDTGLRRANEQLQAGLTVVQAEKVALDTRATNAEKAKVDLEAAAAKANAELARLGNELREFQTKLASAEAGRKAAEDDRDRKVAGVIDPSSDAGTLLSRKDNRITELEQQLAAANSRWTGLIGEWLWTEMGAETQRDLAQKLQAATTGDRKIDPKRAGPYLTVLRARLDSIGTTDAWWKSGAAVTGLSVEQFKNRVVLVIQDKALGQTLARK